jgi:excisionase family DNA binding protein
MRSQLEQADIQAIAETVVSMILPLLNQPQEQDILTIDEVADLLDKSKGQIYQWVSDSRHGLNDFPFLKAGKSLRFSKKDIVQWIQKNGKNG